MYKGQKGANVKTHYEFGNDSMKMCFYHIDCDFFMKHFLL
jgi:hypothetical protein